MPHQSQSALFVTIGLAIICRCACRSTLERDCGISSSPNSLACEAEVQKASSGESLLQRRFRRDGGAFSAEQACDGIISVGKCWYLSELGQSCDSTCAARGFKYAFAVPQHDMVPVLVGHSPARKQSPWLHVECYKPAEDSYHPYNNPNSWPALPKDGDYSDRTCQLACSCGLPGFDYPDQGVERSLSVSPLPGPGSSDSQVAPAGPSRVSPPIFSTPAPPPTVVPICCEAETATCLACKMGASLQEFCRLRPETDGCFTRPCCKAYSAECLACAAGMSVEEYCSQNSMNTVCSSRACCKAAKANCLACAMRVSEEEYCRLYPKTWGCPIAYGSVEAMNRTWFMSGIGESCASTCARNGMSYSWAAPPTNSPMTPLLLGHAAIAKEPWTFVECYEPTDDSYHLVNKKAWGVPGETPQADLTNAANWTHSTCQLACPCTAGLSASCRWVQPPACAQNFEYNGKMYAGCPTVDHDRPWCMHHHHNSGKESYQYRWSNCINTCEQSDNIKPSSLCSWKAAPSCVREFDFVGTRVVGCTALAHDTPWCSNSDPYSGSWAHCLYDCDSPTDEDKNITDQLNKDVEKDDMLCSWEAAGKCSETFTYEGVNYRGCAMFVDYPTPWCSHSPVHNGSWSPCEQVCTRVRSS